MVLRIREAVVAVCGLAFLGYCIYFDRKRRSAPDFKKKLREREWDPLIPPPYFLVYFWAGRKRAYEETKKSETRAKVLLLLHVCL
jgi:hypothetical protein